MGAAFSTAAEATKPNVLFICVDDLRPELACYGKSYIHSPNIDALAASGRRFTHHYVQSPTCGASRFALLTGRYGPSSNKAIFERSQRLAKDADAVPPSMPAWFRKHGYTTVSVGKVSHHPGGRGGSDWDDDALAEMPFSWDAHLCPHLGESGDWQHPRGIMHGLAHGEIRKNRGEMDVFQSTDKALGELKRLSQGNSPFFLAIGIIRPHLPFGAPARYMEPYRNVQLPPIPHPTKPSDVENTTWHGSGEFMNYHRWDRDPNEDNAFATEVRRHYAACVTFADAQIGRIRETLQSSGQEDNTIVVVWGDHGWHLGEHAVWVKHTLYEESLLSPLIINTPPSATAAVAQQGTPAEGVVETIDVFPTLCELTGLPTPDSAHGASLVPMLRDPNAAGHAAISYGKKSRTIRTSTHRLILHQNDCIELYDHRNADAETHNIAAEHPEVVGNLTKQLRSRPTK